MTSYSATCVLPVASVFIAAGGVLQLWGGVSTVIQHVIRQICEQFLQLQKNSTWIRVIKVASQLGCKIIQIEKKG